MDILLHLILCSLGLWGKEGRDGRKISKGFEAGMNGAEMPFRVMFWRMLKIFLLFPHSDLCGEEAETVFHGFL